MISRERLVTILGLASLVFCIVAAQYWAPYLAPVVPPPTPVVLEEPAAPAIPAPVLPVPAAIPSEGEVSAAPVSLPPPAHEVPVPEGEKAPEVPVCVEGETPLPAVLTEGETPVVKSEMEQLRDEVATLHTDMRDLQETLDHLINRVMASLEEENTALKEELKHFYVLQGQQGVGSLPGLTPRRYSGVFDLLRQEAQTENPPLLETPEEPLPEEEPAVDSPEKSASKEVEKPVPSGPFTFTPMKEWGRTTEQAEIIGKEVPSLKGVVGVVPEGSTREDIEKLGRDLRKEYEGFDNINVEVFDTEDAATQFLEQGRTDAAHRVLQVSRHRQSGRDVILYEGGGVEEPVSAEDAAPPPPPKPSKKKK